MSANFRVPRMSEADAVLLTRLAREKRTVTGGKDKPLHIPAWARKDLTLYRELRRRRFKSQAKLDDYLNSVAVRRHKPLVLSRRHPRVLFAATEGTASAPVKRDRRVTSRGDVRNKIRSGEYAFA